MKDLESKVRYAMVKVFPKKDSYPEVCVFHDYRSLKMVSGKTYLEKVNGGLVLVPDKDHYIYKYEVNDECSHNSTYA